MMLSLASRLVVLLVGISLLFTGQVLAVPDANLDSLAAWNDPIPGSKPLFGHQERILKFGKRDCFANGSNYCFGNTVNYCLGCGSTCCLTGEYCCGEGGVCCGTGCCAKDQTCSQGQCLLLTAVTVTSTAYETDIQTTTRTAKVLIVVESQTDILSTVEVTISSAATETNVVWVTETLATGFDAGGTATLARREEEIEGPTATASTLTTTLSTLVTQKTGATRVTYETVTVYQTNILTTTISKTVTRVLNAQVTIDTTSTLTITPRAATTITTITTPTSSSLVVSSSSPDDSSSDLSTSLIAGIGVAGGVVCVIILAVAAFFFRRHRRQPRDSASEISGSMGTSVMPTREPRLPTLPQFIPSSAHHAAQFQPPNPPVTGRVSPQSQTSSSHYRSSSGFTTLVGSAINYSHKLPVKEEVQELPGNGDIRELP